MARQAVLQRDEYRALAEIRYRIRRFLAFSEVAARMSGIEPRQHQLLLALKGLPDGDEPTIGALADRLLLAHHTTVELIDRLERAGLVRRAKSATDRRKVLVEMTEGGERILKKLSLVHKEELRAQGPELVRALEALMAQQIEEQT